MIVTLLLLPILVTANPFHKYPYVFLLDIGNEELEKINTEQIRLSSRGTVAIRYPAVGNGNDITHVRVSGIDFGTDLKASIANGGPGYKYVVIVFMGNPGVEFDAVITIQTVPDATDRDIDNIKNDILVPENDPNNSAEDLTDPEESETSQDVSNEELTQESVVYSYAQNEALSGYGNDETEDDEDRDSDTVGEETGDDLNIRDESYVYEPSEDVYQPSEDVYQPREDVYQPSEDSEQSDNRQYLEDPRINQRSAETYEQSTRRRPVIVDENLYNKYIALKDHLYDESEVYLQSAQEPLNDQIEYRPIVIEDAYDDYEENDLDKTRDPNNNFIDNDEASAVEQ